MKFKRILLKLSGEILGGEKGFGLDNNSLAYVTGEVKKAVHAGAEIGLVIGGGNVFRGAELSRSGFSNKIKGDYIGMMATIINGVALQTSLEDIGLKAKLITAFQVDKVGELYNQDKVMDYLKQGFVIIFCGGTGNPLFTTDTAAALRAIEIQADVLLKATKVDGVFSDDPFKNPNAVKFETISFTEAIEKELKVMDLTAFTLCKENKMPLIVFNALGENNILRIIEKGDVGTLVY